MRIIFIVLAFVMMPNMAFANEWVLWQIMTFSANVLPEKTPLEEHLNLSACRKAIYDAALNKAEYLKSTYPKAKITITGEDVFMQDTTSKISDVMLFSFKCYPSGKTP